MIDVLECVPILESRANSVWRGGNPPEEEIFTGHQTGFKGSFVPGFQTNLIQSKSGYDLVFNGGGKFQGV